MLRKLALSAATICAMITATTMQSNAGETEAFLGGMVGGLVLGEVLDGAPVGYPAYPAYPAYRPYANNYGNFNQQAIVDFYGYDDPTIYRPVCVRFWNGNVQCSMQPVR